MLLGDHYRMKFTYNQPGSRLGKDRIEFLFHGLSYDNEYSSKSTLMEKLLEFEKMEEWIRFEEKMVERMDSFLKVYEACQTHREKTIESLKKCHSSIANVTERTSTVKLILSTGSMLGSAAFLATDYLKIIPDWRMKILTASGIIGSVTILCDVISQYYNKSKMEKMIYLFLLDQDNFEAMNSDKQSKLVSDFIGKSFPFGIDDNVLRDILASQEEMAAKIQLKIKELERRNKILNFNSQKSHSSITVSNSNLLGKFIAYDKVSLQEMLKHLNDIEMDIKNLENDVVKNNEAKIFSVIYLSNVSQKHELLYDTGFIKKARNFSKSFFANFWWNNLENKKSTKHAEKKKLYAEMKSVNKIDKLFWPVVSVAILPLSNNYTANALAIFVTSSVNAFDAFCELTIKIEPKETRILKRLHRILSSEYENLNLGKFCSKNQSG